MKKIIVLIAVVFLSGCSTKFVYKNFDWLVHWYVDDYIDMNKAQKQEFDGYIEQWTQWHKQNELPQYQAHLEELAADIISDNISIERMTYHQDKAREHWFRLRAHIAPGIVDIASTLDEEQITAMFIALEEENLEDEEKFTERMELSEERRKKRWISRNEDNIENWLGRLSNEQEGFIENTYGRFQTNAMNWVQYKRDYQQALKDAFALPDRDAEFQARLLDLVVAPERFRNQEMLAVSAYNERETKLYLLSLYSLSTDKQRQHLLKEINDLRDDIVELRE